MYKFLLTFLSLITLLITQTAHANEWISLEHAIADPHRSAEHKARDQYRHPLQTLQFFDVKNTHAVLEIWPGADGWYTEILAPYLKDHGQLTVANFGSDPETPFFQKNAERFNNKLATNPKLYGKVRITTLQPPADLDIAPEASMDRVLTFRNVHNWMRNDQALAVFKAMFKALKPGGILGVVEHRSAMQTPPDPEAKSGYVSEDEVIKLAMKAGFEFLAKSEVNANPKDTKDYPEGVWTLPPTLKLGQQDRDKYIAIGESDRMTLKFVKLK